MGNYQNKQLEIIAKIENQIGKSNKNFSVVTSVSDFENDERMCLTSVHLPSDDFKKQVQEIINPLKNQFPDHYYYKSESIHITIKNIRVINNPPHFDEDDIKKATVIFSNVIPEHFKFKIHYYRLMLFQNNLALIGTTDEEYGGIILDLDERLSLADLEDDKTYIDSKIFFSNITLARFSKPTDPEFKKRVEEISKSIKFKLYEVDSVSLITSNAVLKKLNTIGTWKLK